MSTEDDVDGLGSALKAFWRTLKNKKPEDKYQRCSKMGTCIIINQRQLRIDEKFSSGSDKDLEALEETFEKLHYNVEVKTNLKCRDMIQVMEEAAERDYTDSTSFVAVYVGSGEESKVYGVDYKKASIDELTSGFKENKSLKGKPKIFIFDVSSPWLCPSPDDLRFPRTLLVRSGSVSSDIPARPGSVPLRALLVRSGRVSSDLIPSRSGSGLRALGPGPLRAPSRLRAPCLIPSVRSLSCPPVRSLSVPFRV
ncbi:hypothetical protein WMY93_009284 [Mugilogobius chulae]|uniref:Caspase family p20 domain-containing protein n=1 Tax=Mugilogobius chulae TaxID=88201 RepID=A0AAW0PED1_9GOBI